MLLAVKTDPKAWKAALEVLPKEWREDREKERNLRKKGKILTSVSSVDPALELLDLRLLPQHLARVGLHPALVLHHVPEDGIM